MFKRWFVKYARAISDERERKGLYRLYCAKLIAAIAFFALCIIALIAMPIFSAQIEEESDPALVAFGFAMLLLVWLVIASAITALTLWIVFRVKFRAILNRPADPWEMPETVSYRQKTSADKKSTKKAMLTPSLILAAGIIIMFILIAVESYRNPESDELGGLADIGIAIFAVCVCVFLVWVIILSAKKAARGQTIEMQTADEAKKIDEAQGRGYKYSLLTDKNLQSLRYLYPNDELRAQAEALQKKSLKATAISGVAAFIVGMAIYIIILSQKNIIGYCLPVVYTAIFIMMLTATLPYSLKLKTLEKQQLKELETRPEYAKNLEIYRKYKAFSKGKGNTMFISLAAATVCAYVLAIIFPDKMWSFLSLILQFVGLFLNNKFVADLRKEVRPIEDEIDMGQYLNRLNKLHTMDIKDILNIEDSNELVISVSEWVNCKQSSGGLSTLTPEERTVLVADSFQQEVNNGGLEQFLLNDSGKFACEALEALTAIGAAWVVEIYKGAFAALPPDLPEDETERDEVLFALITDDVTKLFAECDKQFFEKGGSLEKELYEYILAHRDCFVE